jgi:hypothetical protein
VPGSPDTFIFRLFKTRAANDDQENEQNNDQYKTAAIASSPYAITAITTSAISVHDLTSFKQAKIQLLVTVTETPRSSDYD